MSGVGPPLQSFFSDFLGGGGGGSHPLFWLVSYFVAGDI